MDITLYNQSENCLPCFHSCWVLRTSHKVISILSFQWI